MNNTNIDQLFLAIRNGDTDAVKSLLTAHPELINTPGPRGASPLVMATYFNSLPITQLLLDAGADINAQDGAGNTALMGVSFKGATDIATLLIKAGAELNKQNVNGTTALSFAASYNQPEIVKLLLANGADFKVADKDGKQPADHAREKGFTSVLEQF